MKHFKNLAVCGVACAFVALAGVSFAQDDLDSLLKDLEGDSGKKAEAPKAESKPAESAAEKPAAEEKKAEAEAKVEEPAEGKVEAKVDEKAEAKAEAKVEAKVEEKAEESVAEKPAEKAEVAAEKKEADEKPAATEAPKAEAKATPAAKATDPDAELLANARATEELRRKSFDLQARREIKEARACMEASEFTEAARHYGIAQKLLNDSPASRELFQECTQGVAEGLYRAALQEDETGRRERAVKLMEKAVDMRHPKARAQLEKWLTGDDPNANKTDFSQITHRRNEKEYKDDRARRSQHLKRARQLLSTREIDKALDECEIVLKEDPYNQEAIRLRGAIQKKRALILGQEFEVTRAGMIADVERAWRPVYAPNASTLEDVGATTVRRKVGEDPELVREQSIYKRMKEMRLPTISFKPPATIIDAVDFFRQASKDFDRPDIPLEQRGFNFVIKTPEPIQAAGAKAESADSDDFSANANDEEKAAAPSGVPVIQMITVSDITFYDALKLVCESVGWKFKVQGPIVMVMPKDMSTDEMQTCSYPVVAAFLERMGSASSELKEMKSAGFGGSTLSKKKDEGEENQERDWKEFFSLMGVQWPEGSSILYIKTIGKLRVKNTAENLAELEKALTELNVDQKLVEIEARFVEVQQDDLNSLGFEWILNSNYTIGGGWLQNVLSADNGGYTEGWTQSSPTRTTITTDGGVTYESATKSTLTGSGKQVWSQYDMSGNRLKSGIAGIDSFGGSDSEYGNGNRFLSTTGNHISGEGNSTNDQFMRLNAFIGGADLSMILHMLSQRSDTDLLSAPKILTRPGEEAVIKVVTEYIYPTDFDVQLQSSSSSSGGSSSGGSQSAILAVVEPQSFTMREVGVILDVTPTLTDDGNLIDLKLDTKVVDEPTLKNYGMRIPFTGNSSLQNFEGIEGIFNGVVSIFNSMGTAMDTATKKLFADKAMATAIDAMDSLANQSSIEYYDAPMEQPFFPVRSIESNVSINPGSTIVMGGLITEARKAMDDKVPFLGDLPYIGRFFRSHAEQTTKRNLLIFVTTRLIDVRGREVTVGQAAADAEAEVKPAPDAAPAK